MRSGLFASSIAVLLSVLGTGCSESLPTSAAAPAEQPAPAPNTPVMGLQGYVDLVRGTMTIGSSTPDGVSQSAIYGDQNITVRLYNSGVTRTMVGSKARYSAAVGIRNLRSHPIGDEQGGAAPLDTLGIFVFFIGQPIVTRTSSPCVGCSIRVSNAHGALGFTALAQSYFHYPERLGPAGSSTDTTQSRVTWTFEADSAVTGFSFNVLISAAWPSTHESLWAVAYLGDSLPDTQSEPRWRSDRIGALPTASATAGSLTIATGTGSAAAQLYYERYDSIVQHTSAVIEARLRVNAGSAHPYTSFGFDDDSRKIEIGISNGEVGFIDASYNFIDKVAISTNVTRTYQLRKFGADSVQLWIDGTRRLSSRYNKLKVKSARGIPSFLRFGSYAAAGTSTSSTWDYVVYQIGSVAE